MRSFRRTPCRWGCSGWQSLAVSMISQRLFSRCWGRAGAFGAGASDAPTKPPMSHNPLRILYVEDNPLVRDVTCEWLSQPAREVLAVSSAEEALGVFKPDAFDVVVTDVSLPAMSGLDMARGIL